MSQAMGGKLSHTIWQCTCGNAPPLQSMNSFINLQSTCLRAFPTFNHRETDYCCLALSVVNEGRGGGRCDSAQTVLFLLDSSVVSTQYRLFYCLPFSPPFLCSSSIP